MQLPSQSMAPCVPGCLLNPFWALQITEAVRAKEDHGGGEATLEDVHAAFARLARQHLLERAPPADLPLLQAQLHPDAIVSHLFRPMTPRLRFHAWTQLGHLDKVQNHQQFPLKPGNPMPLRGRGPRTPPHTVSP